VADNSVFVTDTADGKGIRLTPRTPDALAPRPEACVFSPDGKKIAYVRSVPAPAARGADLTGPGAGCPAAQPVNQVFVLFLE